MPERLQRILEQYWGYDAFRPLQREAMSSVLAGRDSLSVLPTGAGKSICFQAPAMALEGMAVVLSPLIALMEDQVSALRECGIPAARIAAGLPDAERREIAEGIRSGSLKLLYVSPERMVRERFVAFLKQARISFVAIDEAHCISMWGHDFRPEYRALRQLKEHFPGIAVHAYTATATPQVREDIVRELALDRPEIHIGNFDRPNLVYKVQRRTDLFRQVTEVIRRHPNESGLVYCIRRDDTVSLGGQLQKAGFRALPYHAGLSDAERLANQQAFMREETDVIVATVAFGMGIDKSNVRYVVHAAMPKSLEHYQQESGRAGRDGLEAECHLLYSGSDFGLWKSILGQSEEQGAEIGLGKLNDLYNYCTSVTCRHRALVQYFGQNLANGDCAACDVCLGDVAQVPGAAEKARAILEALPQLGYTYGAAYLTQVLSGAKEKRIVEKGHDRIAAWGSMAAHGAHAVREWIEQLVSQGFIERTGEYNVLELAARGRAFLDTGAGCPRLAEAAAPGTRERRRSKAAAESWVGVDRALFEKLREFRRDLAAEKSVPAYVIFGDAALRDMARLLPTSLEAFLEVRGVGEQKAKQYARSFLPLIQAHVQPAELDAPEEEAYFEEMEPPETYDYFEAEDAPSPPGRVEEAAHRVSGPPSPVPVPASPATRANAAAPGPQSAPNSSSSPPRPAIRQPGIADEPEAAETLALLEGGQSPAQVAAAMHRDEDWVYAVIEKHVVARRDTHALRWIPQAAYLRVATVAGQAGTLRPERLYPILKHEVPLGVLRVALACLANRSDTE